MSDIHTSIEIDAPAETIWSALTDFGAYPEWNPYTRIEGEPRVDERLRVSPGPEAGRAPTFRPRVLVADGRELRWLGHLFTEGLFDGEHSFVVEELDGDRSTLTQSETFSGLLVGVIMQFVGEDTEANFRGVNEALKARAESLAHGDASDEDTGRTNSSTGEAAVTT
ncbi:MAG: SRPBCC domain-containing protein [Haloarculaceae archaeon]